MPLLPPPEDLVVEVTALCAATPGLVLATLYGSRYAGWATPASDLDLYVVFATVEDFYAGHSLKEALVGLDSRFGIAVEWHTNNLLDLAESMFAAPEQSALLFVGRVIIGDPVGIVPSEILALASDALADRAAVDRLYAGMWRRMAHDAIVWARQCAEPDLKLAWGAEINIARAIRYLLQFEAAAAGGGKDRRDQAVIQAAFSADLVAGDALLVGRLDAAQIEPGLGDNLNAAELSRIIDLLEARQARSL